MAQSDPDPQKAGQVYPGILLACMASFRQRPELAVLVLRVGRGAMAHRCVRMVMVPIITPAMADGIAGKLKFGVGGAHRPLPLYKLSRRYPDDGM